MKKVSVFFSLLLMLAVATSCSKEEIVPNADIPPFIKTYVAQHFSSESIAKCVIEKSESEMYEVTLSNGFELEFNQSRGKVIEIDGRPKLPNSVVPENILQYIQGNYPNNNIIGWELMFTPKSQIVKIDSDKELKFTTAGQFMHIME